jgi:hypothetical protein
MKAVSRGALTCLLGPAALWAVLALWFFSPWPAWMRGLAAAVWLLVVALAWTRLSRLRATLATAFGILLVAVCWTRVAPSIRRDWTEDLARIPRTRFAGDEVEILDVRHATYRSTEDFDVCWQARRLRLDPLERVDFVVEPFADWRGPAHTFLTFGFADGEHLAVSVETRRERGESYGPLKGLFRQHELAYVVGDERDLIGLRANVRGHPVYLYPIRATKAEVRALFVSMLRRANRLAEAPEFYNTLTNTCTTNITRHLAELTGEPLPFDLRVILPGYADGLALELGLIDAEGSLDNLRERFRINARSAFGADGPGWSRQIRQAP